MRHADVSPENVARIRAELAALPAGAEFVCNTLATFAHTHCRAMQAIYPAWTWLKGPAQGTPDQCRLSAGVYRLRKEVIDHRTA